MNSSEAMERSELQVFIDSALHFFDINLGNHGIKAGPARRIAADETITLEYTGVIEISGSKHGKIYFSSPASLIGQILTAMGEPEIEPELVEDLVGEIANSIAGNARSFYGAGFEMSTPKILHNIPINELSGTQQPSYLIPLEWEDNTSHIAVWLM